MDRKWAYGPGEAPKKEDQVERFRSIVQKHNELVESHLANTDSPKTAVMNDGHEIIYFVSLDKDYKKQGIEVAVYNGLDFIYLPDYLAEKLADKYFEYADVMSEMLEHMDGSQLH